MSPMRTTSWTLIMGAAAGDPLDRETFSLRYAPVIKSYLSARWKLPYDHEEVADAAQDVFLQCFKSGGVLDRVHPKETESFKAFLQGVVRNVAAMAERRRATSREQQTRETAQLENVEGSESSFSQAFDSAWARMLVREARERMRSQAEESASATERFRVLEMRYQDGLGPKEIAPRLGSEVELVYELLKKARREFQAALLAVMADYHPQATKRELEQRCIELRGLL